MIRFSIFLVGIFLSLNSMAGVLVGNGGDSLFCRSTGPGTKFSNTGFYVLDYAVNFPEDLSQTVQLISIEQSFDRIEQLLIKHSPEVVPSFLSFRRSWEMSQPKEMADRKWLASTQPLRNIQDEFVRVVPKNCWFSDTLNRVTGLFQQTVVRTNHNNLIVYRYDPEIVSFYINSENPLQLSVLLIHEWLWDFYEQKRTSAIQVRKANAFLHSTAADTVSSFVFNKRVFEYSKRPEPN